MTYKNQIVHSVGKVITVDGIKCYSRIYYGTSNDYENEFCHVIDNVPVINIKG